MDAGGKLDLRHARQLGPHVEVSDGVGVGVGGGGRQLGVPPLPLGEHRQLSSRAESDA